MAEARFGFVCAPASEGEITLLLGYLFPYLGDEPKRLGFEASEYYVERWTEYPTDLVLRAGDNKLRVEIELYSSNFREHDHDPKKCDLIICWENDWQGQSVPVLELRPVVSERFPNLVLDQEERCKRSRVGSLKEFLDRLRKVLPDDEFEEMSSLIEELGQAKGIELILGKGKRNPTVNVWFANLGVSPLAIEIWGTRVRGFVA
jgi:hypothetical protein